MVMSAPVLSKSNSIAPKGITSGNGNLLLEEQVQIGNVLKVEIATINNETLGIQKEIAIVKKDIAGEQLKAEKNNFEIAKNNTEISQERLAQSKDLLSFERENTKVQRELLIVKHNKNLVSLEGAKRELGDLVNLLTLKHEQFQANQISGFGS